MTRPVLHYVTDRNLVDVVDMRYVLGCGDRTVVARATEVRLTHIVHIVSSGLIDGWLCRVVDQLAVRLRIVLLTLHTHMDFRTPC
jgi:hypothetical protein